MRIIRNPAEMQAEVERARRLGSRICVVPTMGALHDGHLSLITLGRRQCDLLIVTLFVNPAQFGKGEDLERYPRAFERDSDLCASSGADILFAPDAAAMYPPGYSTYVEPGGIATLLEGAARPGHFRGVATVVAKLFLLTKPHVAVFGQKDAQQVAVLRQMVRDLNFDVEIVVGPTVRESDGLAMSSRNAYLSPSERIQAPVLNRSLGAAAKMVQSGERDVNDLRRKVTSIIEKESEGQVDYVSVADNRTLVEKETLRDGDEILISMAVRFGRTRLIDNIVLVV